MPDEEQRLLDTFAYDGIVGEYDVPVVQWRDIRYETPAGRLIAVKTRRGMFLHPLFGRKGQEYWGKQDPNRVDKFDIEDVTHWVRLA